jgi:hypothetical protein
MRIFCFLENARILIRVFSLLFSPPPPETFLETTEDQRVRPSGRRSVRVVSAVYVRYLNFRIIKYRLYCSLTSTCKNIVVLITSEFEIQMLLPECGKYSCVLYCLCVRSCGHYGYILPVCLYPPGISLSLRSWMVKGEVPVLN